MLLAARAEGCLAVELALVRKDWDVVHDSAETVTALSARFRALRRQFLGRRRTTHAWQGESPPLPRADVLQDVYMPVSPEAGRLLYALVRACRPKIVVEFGTSFGISTIHLAAAVTDNGTGRVVTTELSHRKAAAARENLEQAGLAGW